MGLLQVGQRGARLFRKAIGASQFRLTAFAVQGRRPQRAFTTWSRRCSQSSSADGPEALLQEFWEIDGQSRLLLFHLFVQSELTRHSWVLPPLEMFPLASGGFASSPCGYAAVHPVIPPGQYDLASVKWVPPSPIPPQYYARQVTTLCLRQRLFA